MLITQWVSKTPLTATDILYTITASNKNVVSNLSCKISKLDGIKLEKLGNNNKILPKCPKHNFQNVQSTMLTRWISFGKSNTVDVTGQQFSNTGVVITKFWNGRCCTPDRRLKSKVELKNLFLLNNCGPGSMTSICWRDCNDCRLPTKILFCFVSNAIANYAIFETKVWGWRYAINKDLLGNKI